MPFSRPPRIYYIHPWMIGPLVRWPSVLDEAAAMGFDHILIAPPFASGGSIFLTTDFEGLHPALGGGAIGKWIADLARLCSERGLSLLLDVFLDRLAAQSDLAAAQPAWFLLRNIGAEDPRQRPEERGAALFRYDQPEILDAALAWWTGLLQGLVSHGVAGFRFDGLANVPAGLIRDLIDNLAGRARFIASTPGLSWDGLAKLSGCGFDAVLSSAAWWDFHSTWLLDERERQRAIAPTISMPEAPFEKRRAAGGLPAQAETAARRTLWFSVLEGDGILVPMGFEYGAEDMLDATRGNPDDLGWWRRTADFDLRDAVRTANAFLAADDRTYAQGPVRMLSSPAADVAVLLRLPGKSGSVAPGRMIVVNARLDRASELAPETVLPRAGSGFAAFVQTVPEQERTLAPGRAVIVPPGEVQAYVAGAAAPVSIAPPKPDRDGVPAGVRRPRIAIENVSPAVDAGRFAVKRTVGETVLVQADIFADGHDVLAAVILWRAADEKLFRETPLKAMPNDVWIGEFPLERMGRYVFAIEAWRDTFGTYRSELSKKHAAGIPVTLEVEEGRLLVEAVASGKSGAAAGLPALLADLGAASESGKVAILLSERVRTAMAAAEPRAFATRTEALYPVDAERIAARFSSWYELFPRSQTDDPARHGTFEDVIARLPAIRRMGFDTLYFPPIHPIGKKNRKGKNNSLGAGTDQPGSPYAIGSEEGGHDAIHPQLGTLEDFRRLVAAAAENGLELVLDFAIQCSPDHPWLREHPDWFNWRPDGSIRYAENPPKKYEDIVNVDFYAPGALPALWLALRDVVLFWADQGVRAFRVDNPHTKPLPFWEWMIGEVRGKYPDCIFLAEAFTRPKMMYRLAKIGFPQSYTYFTWRNDKAEIADYLIELTTTQPREFFRPHFFVNTPDINPVFLQTSGRPGFLIRAALAATLSGLWGMYSGFELCEAAPLPGKEEYLDSEKYEIRVRDWEQPGNIVGEITRLNEIRRANPALQTHLGVAFYNAFNDRILYYGKRTSDLSNFLLIAVNLDPHGTQEAGIEVPLWEFGLPDHGAFVVEDLMADRSFIWRGKNQFLRLDPNHTPFVIFRIRPAS